MRVTGDRLFIRGIVGAGYIGIFLVRTVIDEGPDLDTVRELRDTANVVAVIVRDEHVVQLFEPGLMCRRDNAICIAAFVAWPAGIDEKRLSGWAHDERGLATFYVNEINLK